MNFHGVKIELPIMSQVNCPTKLKMVRLYLNFTNAQGELSGTKGEVHFVGKSKSEIIVGDAQVTGMK
jgi:hypothetical protein